jgi:hypothetical protein
VPIVREPFDGPSGRLQGHRLRARPTAVLAAKALTPRTNRRRSDSGTDAVRRHLASTPARHVHRPVVCCRDIECYRVRGSACGSTASRDRTRGPPRWSTTPLARTSPA